MSFIVRGGPRRLLENVPFCSLHGTSSALYEWAIAMQSSCPSLGIYPRLLLFGLYPPYVHIDAVHRGTSAKSMSNVLNTQQ